MENKKEFIVAILIIAVVIAVIGGYIFMQNSDKSIARQSDPQSNGQAGIIAMLGQMPSPPQVQADSIAPQPQPVDVPQTQPEKTTDKPDETSSEPYTIKLPEGWKKSTKGVEKSCVEGKKALVDTYKKGSEQIKIYENTRPGGCDDKTIADVNLTYSYTVDAKSLVVKDDSIEQCSKDDDASCPKGDGKVSVFIRSAEESMFEPNSKTGNSYFIEITDSEVDPSLEKQVKSLVSLAELLQF